MKFEVGMRLYFVHSDVRRHDYNHHTNVTKVGRKWVSLSNGYRFDKDTMQADGKGYTSPGRLYLSHKITGLPPVSHNEETAGRQLRCIFWLCGFIRSKNACFT